MNVAFADNSYSGRLWRQNPLELDVFLELVRRHKVRRYLEIGVNNGDTFFAVMSAAEPDAFGLAIDLPWSEESADCLRKSVDAINQRGQCAEFVLGSSSDLGSIVTAQKRAPFDLILIDGDHTYDGVTRDWLNYGGMAPVVAFHDVAAPEGHMSEGKSVGVPKLWNELKPKYQSVEIAEPSSCMGFGVIYRA